MSSFDVALVQFKPHKGDLAGNLAALRDIFAQLIAGPATLPHLVVLPEAAMTGYFLEGGVYELSLSAGAFAAKLDAEWRAAGGTSAIDIVCGFYENRDGTYHNSALYATIGGAAVRVVHVHRKMFLPTYGVFDEERFLSRGRHLGVFPTPLGTTAILICEDAWHSIMPTIAALKGARLIIVPSASPGRGLAGSGMLESVERWRATATLMASEHGVYVLYAGLTGFEGGKGMSGSSCIVSPRGELLESLDELSVAILRAQLDGAEVDLARATLPLLGNLGAVLPDLCMTTRCRWRAMGLPMLPVVEAPLHRIDASLAIDAPLTERWLVAFLRDELIERRRITKAVLGLSGGIDSAVVAYLCARALGPENVHAIRMPYRTSSADSLGDAQQIVDALGINVETIEITDAVEGYLRAAGDPDPRRRGNVMARMRMLILFDQAARLNALPIGTGNKTERLMGYFTWHADDTPPVNPIGDLYKTQVWALARHLGVPLQVIDKPPSADLEANQTDEADLGVTYLTADRILSQILSGYRDAQIAAVGFDPREIALVRRRVESTHWKRHLPTTALVSGTAINEFYLRPVDY